MRNFWPCLACNIFYRERHRKLKFSGCNLDIVLYKDYKYPSSVLISAELTKRQTCEFFGTYWDFDEIWLKKTQTSQWSISEIFHSPNVPEVLYECEWNLVNIPNGYRENCSQTWEKLRNSNIRLKIFKLNFLDFWLTDFSKIFRKFRGVDYLSMSKF